MRLKKTRALRRVLRRFKIERKGSTAIEFAFIIVPFLMLTLGTLEIALIHLSRSSMADAMEKSSRQIMTGSAACMSAQEFIDEVCTRLSFSNGTCSDNTKVVMEELTSYTQNPSATDQDFDSIQNKFDNGRDESIMLLRAFHRWNVMFPLLDDALGGGEGELVLVNTLAFRNEPFGATNGCVQP